MVKIRLTRIGKKGEAHYRVIAVRAREKRETKAIEELGFYNPRTNPSTFEVNKDRVKYWLSVGAQPTYTVAILLEKAGLYKVFKKKFHNKPGKKSQARNVEKAAKAEASKAEAEAKKAETAAPKDEPKADPKVENAPEAEAKTEETKA